MLFFASLQWNDPDQLLWISIYTGAAITAILFAFKFCKICTQILAIILICICITMAFWTVPGVINFFQESKLDEALSPMQEDNPHIEQLREILGLLIVLVYSIYTSLKLKQK